MKKRESITLISNGVEERKEVTLLNKKNIGKKIFSPASSIDESIEVYYINDEVEYLELHNFNFNKDTKFHIPQNCILVLVNCTFRKGKIDFIGGSVDLINPTLNDGIYTNRIFLSDVEDFNILKNDKDMSYITILGSAKTATINIKTNINKISLKTGVIALKNINNIKGFKLISDTVIIRNSDIGIDNEMIIETPDLRIEDSQLIYQYDMSISELNVDEITMKDSEILFNDVCTDLAVIRSKKIALNKSVIHSRTDLIIECPEIVLDDKSRLETGESLTLNGDTYFKKDSDDDLLEINSNNAPRLNNYKNLISILKKVKERR